MMNSNNSSGEIGQSIRTSLAIGAFAWVYFSALMIIFRTTAPLSVEAVEAVLLVMLDALSLLMGGGVALAAFLILAAPWRRWWSSLRHPHTDSVPKEEIDELDQRLEDGPD